MIHETIILNEKRNVTLTTYILPVGGEFSTVQKRPVVFVIPGGGYEMCSDREAEPIALAYNRKGYSAVVLRYSVKENAKWPNPLDDYEQAMELVRSKAEVWSINADQITVIGFSAGGHLASAAATIARNKPNAAILAYPCTTKEIMNTLHKDAPGTVEFVDKSTCPCFIFTTRTDGIVPVHNSLAFADALDKNGIEFEMHIYGYGSHGFSLTDFLGNKTGEEYTDLCSRTKNWFEDSVAWLNDVYGTNQEAKFKNAKLWDKTATKLSTENTIGHLMSIPEAVEVLGSVMPMEPSNPFMESLKFSQLGHLLHMAKMPQQVVDTINEKLSKIDNPGI